MITTTTTAGLPVTFTSVAPSTISAENFATWLRGFMEAAGETLDARQLARLREELARVSVAAQLPLQPIGVYPINPYPINPSPLPGVYPGYDWFKITCGSGTAGIGGGVGGGGVLDGVIYGPASCTNVTS